MSMSITIIMTMMTNVDVDDMNIIINIIITTMTMKVAVAIMPKIMHIIITTMTTNVVVAVMITIITITTMQMRYLQAGVRKLHISLMKIS